MEIKRIFIVLFVVILATGCTKNYTCSKEEKSNEFDYSIQMNLIFGSGFNSIFCKARKSTLE